MNKKLYLIRHGQATEKSSHQIDKERELTQTGVQEAINTAAQLVSKKTEIEAMYVSSAERAIQTGLIIANSLNFEKNRIFYDDGLYDASTRTFFQFITQLSDEHRSVCCVGHNPVISYLAEYLTKAEIGDMSTGSCVIIHFEKMDWKEVSQGNGKLVDYILPQK